MFSRMHDFEFLVRKRGVLSTALGIEVTKLLQHQRYKSVSE
jgi:hypothetical protein